MIRALPTLDRAADGSELLTFDRHPPEPDRLAVCEWLRVHGIDTGDVSVPGWIERRVAARQVAYCGYVWETADGRRRIKANAERDGAERVERMVQLESPPMPFPAEVAR